MWDLIKSLLPLVLAASFCACMCIAFLVAIGIGYVLAAIGLSAIIYPVLPICVLVAIVSWCWIARYLYRKVDER